MQEAVSKAASSFFDAMKGQPLALALALINIGLLGFLYYDGVQHNSERQEEMKLLYENRREVAQLLYKCSPADHRD